MNSTTAVAMKEPPSTNRPHHNVPQGQEVLPLLVPVDTSRMILEALNFFRGLDFRVYESSKEPSVKRHPQPFRRNDSRRSETASAKEESNDDGMMTARQRALLVNLINEKFSDPEDRETALHAMESYTKGAASYAIQELLRSPIM